MDGMLAILSQVEDKLNKAEVKAKETFESDNENSRHKLDAEMMRIKERVTTELEAHQADHQQRAGALRQAVAALTTRRRRVEPHGPRRRGGHLRRSTCEELGRG